MFRTTLGPARLRNAGADFFCHLLPREAFLLSFLGQRDANIQHSGFLSKCPLKAWLFQLLLQISIPRAFHVLPHFLGEGPFCFIRFIWSFILTPATFLS